MAPLTTLALLVASATAQSFSLGNWQGSLASGSGVLQSLRPATESTFDFAPSDFFQYRNSTGQYHTGDVTLRWRVQGQEAWQELDTAASRANAPTSRAGVNGALLYSNFTPAFPAAAKHLSLTRSWTQDHGDLVLQATVTSQQSSTVELGAFGFPIEINNIFLNRTADETTAKCSLADPYIGLDAGYVQVTRLTGTGPNLVITPYGKDSKFEAWRFLNEASTANSPYQSQIFEGIYSWQTLSLAYAQNEWNATVPWNKPTSLVLKPGKSVTFALRFSIAASPSAIESAVSSVGRPVAVGLPGYVLPADINGQLFIKSSSKIASTLVEPAGSLSLTPATPSYSAGPWQSFGVTANAGAFGRSRVTITYADGKTQSIHYFLTKSGIDTARGFGQFLFSKQWFTDKSDPFHRAPSVITYDYEAQAQVLQDPRAWICGLSDEGGAGAFEAAAMKTSVHPVPAEVLKLEQMAVETAWGNIQYRQVNGKNVKYGVKKSVFFYEPALVPGYVYDPKIDWTSWTSWNKADAWADWRAYDYVHISALYYGLYSAERANPGILTKQNATWYLLMAYNTVITSQAVDASGAPITAYADVGLMCETVWLEILRALHAEGFTSQFMTLQAAMQKRESLWSSQSEPFGSEMAWDSTGQEGVYLWAKYFNDTATVTKTLNSIRAYMPTVAHWGWNGNARRYWDFIYGGKLRRIERMIHHYGSGLNALPLLDAFQYNPSPSDLTAIYDLRVAYGGTMGPLSNINADGFGAQAFHSYPDTMKWDGYSGDYGPNYLGHILGARTYLVEHPDFGWVSFGGNVQVSGGNAITVSPRDTVRRRIYVAPASLSLEIDAGQITTFTYDQAARTVTVNLDKIDGSTAKLTTLTFKDTLGKGIKLATQGLKSQRDGYAVSIPGTVKFNW